MRRAGRMHGLIGLAAVSLIALATWGVIEAQGSLRATGIVASLKTARTADVPSIIKQLSGYRRWADPPLRRLLKESDPAVAASISTRAWPCSPMTHLRSITLPTVCSPHRRPRCPFCASSCNRTSRKSWLGSGRCSRPRSPVNRLCFRPRAPWPSMLRKTRGGPGTRRGSPNYSFAAIPCPWDPGSSSFVLLGRRSSRPWPPSCATAPRFEPRASASWPQRSFPITPTINPTPSPNF